MKGCVELFVKEINPMAVEFDGGYLLFETPNHQFRFSILLQRLEIGWKTKRLYHELYEFSAKYCPFCGKKDQMYCLALQEHIDDLFEVLQHQPKVRLALLF